MSILEDNRKIAEYVGYEVIGQGNDYLIVREGEDQPEIHYAPNMFWDDLMEVVEKIEKEHTYVSIFGRCCTIELFVDGVKVDAIVKQADTKHQAVYQAVLEYIKQQKED